MAFFFWIVGIIAWAVGGLTLLASKSAVHEILASVVIATGFIAVGFGVLIQKAGVALQRLEKIADNTKQTLDLMQAVRQRKSPAGE